jgi:hypothetical protein
VAEAHQGIDVRLAGQAASYAGHRRLRAAGRLR